MSERLFFLVSIRLNDTTYTSKLEFDLLGFALKMD